MKSQRFFTSHGSSGDLMFAAAAVASARAFSLSSTLGDHMVVLMNWSKDGARVGLDL